MKPVSSTSADGIRNFFKMSGKRRNQQSSVHHSKESTSLSWKSNESLTSFVHKKILSFAVQLVHGLSVAYIEYYRTIFTSQVHL